MSNFYILGLVGSAVLAEVLVEDSGNVLVSHDSEHLFTPFESTTHRHDVRQLYHVKHKGIFIAFVAKSFIVTERGKV